MKNIIELLEEITNVSQIPFDVISEEGKKIMDANVIDGTRESKRFMVDLITCKAYAYVDGTYEKCIPLLKFLIQDKCKELLSVREQLLINIIKEDEFSKVEACGNLPKIYNDTAVFVLQLEGNKKEALDIVQELYKTEDVISVIYEDNIVILGNFPETYDHGESIKETISTYLYYNCVLAYENIKDYDDLKEAYKRCKECISVNKNFRLKSGVITYKSLMFEDMIMYLDPNKKRDMVQRFSSYFNELDKEMQNTIELFISTGLNISEAAKKLYIHRNTLIYRLDKISKDTGFDIRNFKEASIFLAGYLLWRENQ